MNQPRRAVANRVPASASPAAQVRPRVLERLRERAAEGERQRGMQISALERLLEWARGLLRPAPLRHAAAALLRGNLEAAFALLREEVAARPERAESTLLFWEVAQSCERPRDAAEALARHLQREVSDGQLHAATEHWVALVGQVPEARIDISALVRILPVLRARIASARGEVAQRLARERLGDALRRSVDPENGGLAPALALRVVDEARGIDLEVAKQAARAALGSSSLHEAKRGKLEELLRTLERGEWPDGPAAEPTAPRPAAASRPASPRTAPVRTPAAPRAPAPARPVAPARPAAAAASRPETVSQPAAARRSRPDPAAPAARSAAPRPIARPDAEAAAQTAAPAPSVAAADPLDEPGVPTGSPGRRSVALSADEIEAASMRLAERMAARSAAAQSADAAGAPDASAPADEPAAAVSPTAIVEAVAIAQDDSAAEAEYLSDLDAESAFGPALEVDPGALSPEALEEPIDAPIEEGDLSLGESDLSIETGDAVPLDDDEPSAVPLAATESEESDADFEFGAGVALEPAPSAAAPAAGSEADFEFGAAEPLPDGDDADLPSEVAPVAAASSGGALRAIAITPVELGDEGLVAWEVENGQRTRVDYRAVEFLAAAEVEGLADGPILLIDLILRARAGRPRSSLRICSDAFDAAALYPDRTDAGQALRAMLSDLLERTRAIPLPDPDSALGVRPQRFSSLAEFEAVTRKRMAS